MSRDTNFAKFMLFESKRRHFMPCDLPTLEEASFITNPPLRKIEYINAKYTGSLQPNSQCLIPDYKLIDSILLEWKKKKKKKITTHNKAEDFLFLAITTTAAILLIEPLIEQAINCLHLKPKARVRSGRYCKA